MRVVQVTPYALGQRHEVNRFVEAVSEGLGERGHEVEVVGPSGPGRALTRKAERMLEGGGFDFVHVHEPWVPSAAASALRRSRALNVGTFHSPSERFVSTQVARKRVGRLFGRLDARTASYAVTREVVERYFPGEYELVRPGAELVEPVAHEGPAEIFFAAEEERGALRVLLRGLRKLPRELDWRATVWVPDPATAPPPPQLSRRMRERVRFVGPGDGPEADFLARADVAVAASAGAAPAPQLVQRMLAAGAVPVVAGLTQYGELVDDGDLGMLFPVRDAVTLAAQLERLLSQDGLRREIGARIAGERERLAWSRTVDELEAIYERVAARRHDPAGRPAVRRRIERRDFVHVDLHMHTDHSSDCATPARTLLETAKQVGLDAIAITDHNEVSGAHEARELAREIGGIEVIVAEEVKTAEQGEVIGLFVEEKIPRGMTLAETIAAIKAQGGLVYVPHPFDRMHSVPDYEHLLGVVEQIDALEVFNPRVAFAAFNDEAARFAEKYRIVAGAGSDSHVAAGLGSVKIRMRAFDGPEEFLESLRDADIVRKRQSLLYVQALKFIQTRATPEAARRRTARPGGGARRASSK